MEDGQMMGYTRLFNVWWRAPVLAHRVPGGEMVFLFCKSALWSKRYSAILSVKLQASSLSITGMALWLLPLISSSKWETVMEACARSMPQPMSQENWLSVDQLLWRNFPIAAGSNLSPWLVSDKPLYGKAWWCIACPASTASVSTSPTILHIHFAPVQK